MVNLVRLGIVPFLDSFKLKNYNMVLEMVEKVVC